MKKQFLLSLILIGLVINILSPLSLVAYAEDWVLASQLPEGTVPTGYKWTYTQTYYTTSTSSSLSGWEKDNPAWTWSEYDKDWTDWTDEKKTVGDNSAYAIAKERTVYNYYRYTKKAMSITVQGAIKRLIHGIKNIHINLHQNYPHQPLLLIHNHINGIAQIQVVVGIVYGKIVRLKLLNIDIRLGIKFITIKEAKTKNRIAHCHHPEMVFQMFKHGLHIDMYNIRLI